jgi:gliding motility-associated-like protein
MRILLTLFLLSCSAFAKAQLESSHWYFGLNAGIDFNSGVAVPDDLGQLLTGEGCAAISDSNGNLLFYTDGTVVYDRNHMLMPNGTGLKGNSSSTSSAIIVPLPGNAAVYYVFTVNTNDNFYRDAEGLYFSVIDLSRNGGNGDVDPLQKNINLLPLTSEKLTAISNASGDGFWMLTQFGNSFYAYEITASGLNLTPVISTEAPFIELVNTSISNVDVVNMRGYLKLNARGDKLVAAHFSNNTLSDFNGITSVLEARSIAYAQGGELYLYDFNNDTGIVSNAQPLLTKANGGSFYGIEFSGNGKYLYAEIDYYRPSTTQVIDLNFGEIAQWDLTSTSIAASRTTVYTDSLTPFRGALQMGLDNKIYHSRLNQTALSVLNIPNNSGLAANYTFNSFQLSPGKFAFYGLPIFVQSFFVDGQIQTADHCFGETATFSIITAASIDVILWDFGDPASGTQNTTTALIPAHVYSAPGTYNVTAVITTLVNSFTVTTVIQVFENITVQDYPVSLEACIEEMNQAIFDLSQIPRTISITQGQLVSVHESMEDALSTSNPVDTAVPYSISSTPQNLFIRVSNTNCSKVFPLTLSIKKCPINVFNVITPDGDGLNDTFTVSGLRDIYPNHKIYIYTRYGQKIWEGNNDSPNWDGRATMGLGHSNDILPTGTYFYVIELNEPDVAPQAGYIYLKGN